MIAVAFHRNYSGVKQTTIGQLIRELRKTLKLTQEKFAAQLGVSFPTINRWENGHATLSPLALGQIEILLNQLVESSDEALRERNQTIQGKYLPSRRAKIMRAVQHQEIPDNIFGGGGELETLLRSHDWSQTSLGAVETWSEGLKTAVQSQLTELNQAQRPNEIQQALVPSQNCTQTVTLSDHKQTEAVLQESEELKRCILESSKDCIKILTLEGRLLYLSTGGLHLLEIDNPTSVLNAQWLDFWQGEDYQSAKTALAVAKAGHLGQFQGYAPTAKGNLKWWDVIVTPIRDASGRVAKLLSISRDITKQKQADLEREQLLKREQAAREDAERANWIKGEFLTVLSHELRSPLNPILGWTQLLQNGKLDSAHQINALDAIERNAKLQAQLIEDLLDISRIMQGKLILIATPVSLAFVIAAAVETVRLAAAAKNIQITLDLDPDVAPVSGDAAWLQQVVWNLLTNAVKFTDNGGQVTVELRRVATESSLGNRMVQIRVIDLGKGISPQFLPHVFEHFRQEDGSMTRQFGGLGLGLAIVRQVVELHGGTVKAESRGEHQGATFSVQLPALQQATPVRSEQNQLQSASDSETRFDNVQILLVDDDADTREFQSFLLEQHGATVTAVASGVEALQALEQWLPDVIVSDIGMAEMDGYRLMQQIRSRPPAQGGMVPAIALTAYAAEIDQKKAFQAGFQTHLTKPLESERLVSEIITLLKPNRV